MLLLDRFPVSCTEPNNLILNRFSAGKCFVVKFALLYLSLLVMLVSHVNRRLNCLRMVVLNKTFIYSLQLCSFSYLDKLPVQYTDHYKNKQWA